MAAFTSDDTTELLKNGFYGQGVPPATTGYGAHGTIPQLPDPVNTAIGATQGNISNVGNIGALGAGLTKISAQDALDQYTANFPNYMALTNQASQNALAHEQGQLTQGTKNLLWQQGAERGVGMGAIDSPNNDAALLRALGLTAEQLQSQGAQERAGLYATTPTGPQFNPSSMLVTPKDEQDAASMQAIYNSAPNPDLAAAEALRLLKEGLDKGGGGPPAPPPGPGPVIPPPKTPPPDNRDIPGGNYNTTPNKGDHVFTNPDGSKIIVHPDGTTTNVPADTSNRVGPNPLQGPNINPSTGAFTGGFQGPNVDPVTGRFTGGFQGANIDPLTGGFSGGYQGPNINPVTGGFQGGYQGPAINPVTGGFQGGFQGPLIDPLTGTYTGDGSDQNYPDYAQFPYENYTDSGAGATDPNYDSALWGDYSGYLDEPPPTNTSDYTDWAAEQNAYWYGEEP